VFKIFAFSLVLSLINIYLFLVFLSAKIFGDSSNTSNSIIFEIISNNNKFQFLYLIVKIESILIFSVSNIAKNSDSYYRNFALFL